MAGTITPEIRPAVTRSDRKRQPGSLESYAHKAAKSVVAGWFRDAAAAVGFDGCAICLDIPWRVNRAPPTYGVWEEYPVLADGTGIDRVWDEAGYATPPTFTQLVARGTPPRAVLDIAVQHKGAIIAGIEIVHKNPPSEMKIAFLRGAYLDTLLILPARWVLGQVRCPESLPPKFLACGGAL